MTQKSGIVAAQPHAETPLSIESLVTCVQSPSVTVFLLKRFARQSPDASATLLCSMAEEFPALMDDISELEWANEAFGGRPEATNLWIGGNESVTSFHKVPTSGISCPSHKQTRAAFAMLMTMWPKSD